METAAVCSRELRRGRAKNATERSRRAKRGSRTRADGGTQVLQYYRLGHRKHFKLQRTPEVRDDEVIYATGEGMACAMPKTLGEWLEANGHLWTDI
jgi:hypothetical protein